MADDIPAPVAHFRAEATEFFAVLAKMHAETDRTTTGVAGKAKLMSDAYKARLDEIASKNNGVISSMAKVASQAGVMGAAVATGAAVGAIALAEFAKHGVEDYLKLTDSVIKFQRVSGATAQESSQLVAVSHVLGVSADATALAVYRLGVSVSNHADKLKADGIEIARNKSGHVDLAATLLNVGDAYKKAGAGAEGDKILNDAVGRGGKVLIPILEQTRDRINEIEEAAKRHGEIFSQQDLENTKAFHIAVKEAGAAVEGLAVPLGSLLVPILTGFADVGAKAADVIHSIAHEAGGLLPVIGLTAIAVGVSTGGISLLVGALAAGAAGLYAMGKAHVDDKNAAEADAQANAEFAKGLKADEQAARDVISAEHALSAAQKAVADSNQSLRDAQRALNQDMQKGVDVARAIADAHRQIQDANKALDDSMLSLNDATQKYAALIAAGPVDEKAVAAARDTLAQANQRLDDSTYGLGEAQKALDKLLKDGAVDSKAVAAARQSLQDANRNVETTTRSLGDAQEALSTLLAAGAVDARAVESARRSMITSDRTAATATRDLSKAQSDLNALLAGPSTEDAQKAALAVAEAVNTQADAQMRLRDANALAAEARSEGVTGDVLAKILLDQSNADIASRRAALTLQDAQAAQQKIQTDALPTSQAYQDAQQKVTDANDRLTDALTNQQDAHDALAKAQAGDPSFDKRVADARQKVADETYALGKAQESAQKSQQDLTTALAGDPDFLDKVEKARRAVRLATREVEQANKDAKTANDDLQKTLGGDPEYATKVQTALGNIKDATEAVRRKAEDTGTAEDNLRKALQGPANWAEQIAADRRTVAGAIDGIKQAHYNLFTAMDTLKTKKDAEAVTFGQYPDAVKPALDALRSLEVQAGLTNSQLNSLERQRHIPIPTTSGGGAGTTFSGPGANPVNPDSSRNPDGTVKAPGTRGGPINPVSPPSTEGYFAQPGSATSTAPPDGSSSQWSTTNPFPNGQHIVPAPVQFNTGVGDIFGGNTNPFYGYNPGSTSGGIGNRLYDEGGILPPGVTMAENRSGHNEHVLTDSQLARRGGGGATYHFHIANLVTQAKSTGEIVKDLVNYSKRNGPLQITVQS